MLERALRLTSGIVENVQVVSEVNKDISITSILVQDVHTTSKIITTIEIVTPLSLEYV